MAEQLHLKKPWMIAVWPGMGHVAINAGYYLASKLNMRVFAEFSPRELFDVEHVEVENGLIHPGKLPRSRFFVWRDPHERRDLVLFIGEAQPPSGKRTFCQSLLQLAQNMGVEQVFTFAAMGTQMHPEHASRTFVAATDEETLDELRLLDVQVLEGGMISGLNGVLLGEVAAANMHGACLLGELPQIFAQVPFPGGALAVLKTFSELSGIRVELEELEEQAHEMGHKLGEVLAQVEGAIESVEAEEEPPAAEPVEEPKLTFEQERRIEQLFTEARQDRSKAYVLKQELDRLNVFREYEDRFLDLFQNRAA